MSDNTERYNVLVIRNKITGSVFYATRKEGETVKVYTSRLRSAVKSRSNNLLVRSIRFYGLDSFSIRVEGTYETKQEALKRKVELVTEKATNLLVTNMPAFGSVYTVP